MLFEKVTRDCYDNQNTLLPFNTIFEKFYLYTTSICMLYVAIYDLRFKLNFVFHIENGDFMKIVIHRLRRKKM